MGAELFGWDSKPTVIDLSKVKDKHELSPKRFCFKTFHKNSLRTTTFNGNIAAFYIPFKESIIPIFEAETGLATYATSSGKFWCPIESELDYEKAKQFKAKYEERVFLRDNLDLSVALAENMLEEGERSEIGELEYQAKFHSCHASHEKLVDLCANFISTTPKYQEATSICAVPSSKSGEYNTPMIIAEIVAEKLGLKSYCAEINWKKNKVGLKNLTFDEKWPLLESTGLDISANIGEENKIILLDDLYQSGVTIQYVGMKLKEIGCKKVYGLSIVKSRRDDDNQ